MSVVSRKTAPSEVTNVDTCPATTNSLKCLNL